MLSDTNTQNISFSDLPQNALLQIVGDKKLDRKDLYSILTVSKQMHNAVKPRCEVEQLLSWIQTSLAHGQPEKFQIGRMVLQAWEKRCIRHLDTFYKEGVPISINQLERRIKKLENLFRDFLRQTLKEKNSREQENEIPIPFDLKIPALLERIFSQKCLAYLSHSYPMPLDDNDDPKQSIQTKQFAGYVPPLQFIQIDETKNQTLGAQEAPPVDLTQTERIFFQSDLSSGFTTSDVKKLSHFVPDCFVNAYDREIVTKRFKEVYYLQGDKWVTVFRPSKSKPGNIVITSDSDKAGNWAHTHALINPSISTLGEMYDFLRNNDYQWLPEAERKHNIVPKGTLFCQELEVKHEELNQEIIDLHDKGEIFFSNTMNRDEAEKALQGQENGVFLIRLSAQKNKGNNIYVLSLIQDKKISHTKIEVDPSGKLSIDPMLYDSLAEYLTYAKNSKLITKPFSPGGEKEKEEEPYTYENENPQ